MAEDIQSNIRFNVDTAAALSNIKALQSQLSAFYSQMAKSGAAANAVVSGMQQNFINSVNMSGKFNASIQNIKTSTESFNTALEKNKFSIGEYFRYAVASTKDFGKVFKTEHQTITKVAIERVKDLQTQYIKLGRDANGSMKAIAVRPLTLDMDNLATKTAIAAQKQQLLNQLLHQGSTQLLNWGKNTQWAGRQLMVGFTIPLMAAGSAAAKYYQELEAGAIKIKRVYGDLATTAQETESMVKQIQSLATEYTKYGVAVADTMQMAADAAAMGKTGVDLLAQVNQATKLSVLGGVDQGKALETTISLTSAFGITTSELTDKINYLNAVENQTILNIDDMTTAIPKAAPVVKQLGGSVEDLAFFLTAMKEGGVNASEGANALKSGLASIINPTKKASEFLQGFGINVSGIVKADQGNLKKTVLDFASALNTLDPLNRAKAIEMMFGKFQFARMSTLFQNITKEGSQAQTALDLANMSSIQRAALARQELDKIQSSPMYKFQKAIADLQLKLAPVGETFLKTVTPIIGFVSKVLEGFNKLGDGAKTFIVGAVSVLGGLAPVLLMVIGLVANGAANLLKFFAGIKNFFNKTTTASQVLGETTNYMTQEQIKAAAVAASLDQVHSKLKQTFTSEAAAVNLYADALQRANTIAGQYGVPGVSKRPGKKMAGGGMVVGPGGPKDDLVPTDLSNGEAVIDADTVRKNPRIIAALFSGKKINIPGYAKNNASQVGLPVKRADIEASHGSDMSPTTMSDLVSETAALIPEFAKFKVTLMELTRAEDGMLEVTKRQVAMSDIGKQSTMFAGGISYGGTTMGQTGQTNLAFETIGVKGFATTLDEAVEQGKAAEKALADLATGARTFNVAAVPELEKLAVEGQNATAALSNSATADEERIKYTRAYTKEIIRQGLLAGKFGGQRYTAEQAVIKAEELLAKADTEIAQDKSKNRVRNARLRYFATGLMNSGTGEISATNDPNVPGFMVREVNKGTVTPQTSGTQSGAGSVKRREGIRAAFSYVGRAFGFRGKTAKTVAERFDNAGMPIATSPMAAYEARDTFNDSLQKEAKTASPSKRTAKIAKDTVDGYANELEAGKQKITGIAVAQTQAQNDAELRNLEIRRQQAEMMGADTAVIEREISQRQALLTATEANIIAQKQQVAVEQASAVAKQSKVNSDFIGPLAPNQSRRGKIGTGIDKMKQGMVGKTASTGGLMQLTMAASVAAGALSMIPGPIGSFMQTLTPMIAIAGGVASVLSMFGLTAEVVTAQSGALALSFMGLEIPLLPIVAGFIALAAIIGLSIAATNAANDARKKELEHINASSDAYKKFNKTADALAQLAGVQGTTIDTTKIAQMSGYGVKANKMSDVDTLLKSSEFTTKGSDIYESIQKIKKMTNTQASSYIYSLGQKELGLGVKPEDVDSIIKAVQIAAGKKDLNLTFKSLDLNNPENIKSVGASLDKFNTEINKNSNFNSYKQVSTSDTGDAVYQQVTDQKKKDIFDNAIGSKVGASQQIIAGLNDQYAKGTIKLKTYKDGIAQVTESIKKMSAAGKAAYFAQLFEKQSDKIKAIAGSITDVSTKMRLYQAISLLGGDAVQEKLSHIPEKFNEITNATARASAIQSWYNSELKGMVDAALPNLQEVMKQVNAGMDQVGGSTGAVVKTLKDFIKEQQNAIKSAKDQIVAFGKLRKAGVDVATAYKMIQDAELAGAIARSKNSKELAKFIALYRQAQLMAELAKSPQERHIAVLQAKNDVYQAALDKLSDKEKEVNKAYDKRIDALNQVQKAQEAIAAAQRDQLDVADALSRGDIAAAAKAAQKMRESQASRAMTDQKDALESARTTTLQGLSVEVNGQNMTRDQIETAVAANTAQINSETLVQQQQNQESLNALFTDKKALKGVAGAGALGALGTTLSKRLDLLSKTIGKEKAAIASKKTGAKADAKSQAHIDKMRAEATQIYAQLSGMAQGIQNKSSGGMINPMRFAMGGYAMGTDTVPAMLTPGEFIVNAGATNKYGTSMLSKINAGTFDMPDSISAPIFNSPVSNINSTPVINTSSNTVDNSSVYNSYSINVNASTGANPEEIARVVMNKIRNIDSQSVRGNRL